MSVVEPIPALIQSRRRLASELLTAAARHSAVVDEIHDLELLKEQRPWTEHEAARYADLRTACDRNQAERRSLMLARCRT